MFYVELKPNSNNKDIYEIDSFSNAEENLNYHIQNMRFLNVIIARDMSHKKLLLSKSKMHQMHRKLPNH